MVNLSSRFRRALVVFVFSAFVLAFSGCDSGSNGDNILTLQIEVSEDMNGKDIDFTFASDTFQTGRLEDVPCGCNIEIDAFLESRGFTKSDIQSARLKSARLVMLFPVSERLDFLSQAILKFESDGLSATEVANQSSFPSAREAGLTILSNRDITSFLTRSNFKAILQIDAQRLLPAEDYDMALVMEIEMDVTGP